MKYCTEEIRVQPVSLDLVRTIRHPVLRPGKPFETTLWPGDEDFNTVHFGAFINGTLVGVASLFQKSCGATEENRVYQLRGMAVLEKFQYQGIGTGLIDYCIAYVRRRGGKLIWCNSRAHAAGFYQRHGFVIDGEAFDIPEIGPHYRMQRSL
ncbi:MAG TPA: GNAT family N-acetyltransferase [Candidatus Hydrogenedentes bacterium]|nr:GNAT family N-acetyltransferase [Candidatus Hydrogenedentota bacterium]